MWQLPKTVTELRGFLGLCNYFSEYVDHYADAAGPLTEKLKLSREDGKKGSTKAVEWSPEDIKAFKSLKIKLSNDLELFQVDPDRPFVMRCDASNFSIGAVLDQAHPEDTGTGKIDIGHTRLVPVSFFSRKLAESQFNWTPREKDTYAIVALLRKWAGHIGFQPVIVVTDHCSLRQWVTEHWTPPPVQGAGVLGGKKPCPTLTWRFCTCPGPRISWPTPCRGTRILLLSSVKT
jgi:hypothetical protein